MRIPSKILLGALIFVLCAAAAYAQVGISSIPVTTVRSTGRAELAGSVRVTANAATAADTFTIRYGLPITNGTTTGLGLNAGGTWPAGCAIAGVDNTNGVVTVTCPAATAANQYFQLDGVRVSVDGYTASNVTAQIGALSTPITAGQTSAVVIESLTAGLVAGAAGTAQTVLANTANISAAGTFFVKEGFASAFKTITDEGTGATQATKILLTLTGLPANVTVTVSTDATTTAGLTVSYSGTTFTSAATTRTVTVTGESLATLETLGFDFNVSFAGPTLPLAATSYSVSATLTTNEAALTAGAPVVPFTAPKFAVSSLSGTILTVLPNTTTFLVPYASTQSVYDTGIAIANTTTDPFGTTGGTAAVQSGTITFNFYPNDGTTIASYTTAAGSPGSGLSATGVLTSGSTYTVLLSQLIGAAAPTRTAKFSGYIIAVVGASDCHGIAYISDFAGKFTSYTPMLIIPNPAVAAAAATVGGARSTLVNEILGQ